MKSSSAFLANLKPSEKLQYTINIVMVIFVITSITLTIIESNENIMTPELRSVFLSIHIAILTAFLAEFFYRLWYSPDLYPGLTAGKARLRFLVHPLTVIDMVVIAPLFIMIWTQNLHNADIVVLRILRFTSIFNLFHFYRTSRIMRLIKAMSREIWYEMFVVLVLSIQCILLSGVIFYAVENEVNSQVTNIFDGIWWSVTTLTTIGYGDIYPITSGGRILGIILAFVGVGLIALPTGILTSAFIRALRSEKKISHMADEFAVEEREQDRLVWRMARMEREIFEKKKNKKKK